MNTNDEAAMTRRFPGWSWHRQREFDEQKRRLTSSEYQWGAWDSGKLHRLDRNCLGNLKTYVASDYVHMHAKLLLYTTEQACQRVASGRDKFCTTCDPSAKPAVEKAGRQDGDKVGYVYVVGAAGSQTVKIGFSTDVTKRLQSLRNASPEDLKVLWHAHAKLNTEFQLHQKFRKNRLRGEWFRFDDNQNPIDVVRAAALRLGAREVEK
ncbi:GIY-YIG nuclease family protein [Amycolatopsis carbonis]|uniref:GIY-YIG nuclease family protein n=1 Tax=Amycolatopsis carbonis TaxID=715471 RepID=A0A9Y2MUL4_9PSEU|nr:GIY-YIG nuclease family protein [Amycolatopsis sp. 2-15]WIX75999.1 GIY-YIG nuclease family protein [Amycolatopsis sp. 2-15]